MSFVGDYNVKTDSKNRIAIPAAFRKQLTASGEEGFVLQKDIFQKCLVLYPKSEWDIQVARLRERLNPYNKAHKRFKSQFFRDTAEITIDNGGRILLPKRLIDLVDISKDITLAGLDKSIEVWNKTDYDAYGMDEEDFATLTEELLGNDTPTAEQ